MKFFKNLSMKPKLTVMFLLTWLLSLILNNPCLYKILVVQGIFLLTWLLSMILNNPCLYKILVVHGMFPATLIPAGISTGRFAGSRT